MGVCESTDARAEKLARVDYLDVFRGFGIIVMVMGHIGYGSTFDFFIHAFHMPMFFWISGYLFAYRNKPEISFFTLVCKKAKTLLLPYFVFGVAHYIVYASEKLIIYKKIDIYPMTRLLSVNTSGLPGCGALWFLTALFFTELLYFLINKYIVCKGLKVIIIAFIALLGNLANMIFPFTLPYALSQSFVGIGLFYIGYLCKKYNKQKVLYFIMNLEWIPNIILGVITTMLIFANGYINMRTEDYSVIPLFWINALLSVFVGISFCKLIYKYIQNNCIGEWLIGIGRDSIVYVCLNQIIIKIVKNGIDILGLSKYFSKVLILIISLLALWMVSRIILNTKLKILIGKR